MFYAVTAGDDGRATGRDGPGQTVRNDNEDLARPRLGARTRGGIG